MAEQAAPSSGAPASDPEAAQIQLGPHADIYPPSVRTPSPPQTESEQADEDEAPEPEAGAAAPPQPEPDAGVPPAEQRPEQPKRSRRQAGEEAYQRGLSEGRAAAARDVQERQHREFVERTQREANERIEQLFQQLTAPGFQQREEAGRQLAAIHHQTLQGTQALEIARQQINAQMAQDFATVRELEGASDDDYQDLLKSTSMSDFAKKVHAIGQRGLRDRITKLEAELQAARAHALGARGTPEAANGAGRIGQFAMHDLQNMSLKEQRKLEGTPEYDRMVAQHLADRASGRI